MIWILSILTVTGFNFTFWMIIGVVRFIVEKIHRKRKKLIDIFPNMIETREVAAIIPAHNEEETIEKTIKALCKILPHKNIYVASDYSTDRTLEIVRKLGVRALDIKPNKGKAKSLVWIMNEYKLLDAYKLILINDADTIINEHYLERALPFFNDPEIAAVAPHGVTRWKNYGFWHTYFIAYRLRLWRFVQIGMRYGMTWKVTNVSYIIPGSLSLYRTSVLRQLEIDAPGLIIEDFNMTFEVHKKKLGKIAYSPSIYGIHQDPYNFRDYVKQVTRWNVGFWQTVKRHGIWPSLFCFTTLSFSIELYLYCIFILLSPILLGFFILSDFQPVQLPVYSERLTIIDFIIGVFLMDYLITIFAAISERKFIILLYGLGFLFLRYVDSVIYVASPFIAFTKKYSGTLQSPKRL